MLAGFFKQCLNLPPQPVFLTLHIEQASGSRLLLELEMPIDSLADRCANIPSASPHGMVEDWLEAGLIPKSCWLPTGGSPTAICGLTCGTHSVCEDDSFLRRGGSTLPGKAMFSRGAGIEA